MVGGGDHFYLKFNIYRNFGLTGPRWIEIADFNRYQKR